VRHLVGVLGQRFVLVFERGVGGERQVELVDPAEVEAGTALSASRFSGLAPLVPATDIGVADTLDEDSRLGVKLFSLLNCFFLCWRSR
jgi:hypothetical protein